jgi:sulfonate transport system substrate-binding protein
MSFVKRIAALWMMGALALLAACSGGGQGDEKIVRIISSGKIIQGKYVPGSLGGVVDEQGWLRKQLEAKGWKLEFVNMPHAIGGPMINEGFANKSLEFAYYGDLPAVIGAGGGAPIQTVLSLKGTMSSYLLVPPGSPARSIRDLKGKRLALHRGRPWEMPFAHLAEANGLKLSDFKIINVNPSAGAAALAAGKVDAYVGTVADTFRLTSKNAGRILWSTKEAPADWVGRTELFGRKDFVSSHPDISTLVAAAYLRAGQWAAKPENKDAYIRRLSQETPEAAIRADVEGTGAWGERFELSSPEVLKAHYRYIIDYAAATGLIQDKPKLEDMTETRLVPAAVKLAADPQGATAHAAAQ